MPLLTLMMVNPSPKRDHISNCGCSAKETEINVNSLIILAFNVGLLHVLPTLTEFQMENKMAAYLKNIFTLSYTSSSHITR